MKGLLFTYALTYGGASIALFNPFYGLLVYVCFAIIRPEYMWPWSVSEGNYSRIVALGLLAGWALRGFGRWKFGLARGAALLMIHAMLFSFSRGGMLSLVVTGVVGFLLVPKKWQHYVVFAAVVLVGLRLAGPEVTNRFWTTFAGEAERDASAQSRVDLWAGCWDSMLKRP